MFKYFLLFVLLLNSRQDLYAATLHALVVCDTHAIDLEDEVEYDKKHIKKFFNEISKNTALKVQKYFFSGFDVDVDFQFCIHTMPVKEDDVILFYYSGHGVRYLSQCDNYPIFDLEYDDPVVSHYEVTKKLAEKNPRLLLSIADCCNVYQDDSLNYNPASLAKDLEAKKIHPYVQKNWETLFLHSRGFYIATSASPGEASIALGESDGEIGVKGGSFYTNALLNAFQMSLYEENMVPTWEAIFEMSTTLTLEYQVKDPDDPVIYHHAQFERWK